jgi:2-C-methyl-D-erythritol 2,4-cyclodiphosphate synthase
MPVGIGYDVHRLGPGRRLVLGGVEFPSEVGLLGHSDADVATHAIMDALLGAAALGDIGVHFPPGDPRFAGADSVDLLRRVVTLLQARSLRVGNVDVSIVAERPRIGPRVGEMRRVLANAIGVQPEAVSVKATTHEGLGFLGRGEGIAAIAVAEVVPVAPATIEPTLSPRGSTDE